MNKEDCLDKYFYHSKDNDGNKLFDREVCLKAMKDYAIAMCEEQKKSCTENATAYLDANDNPIVAKGSILITKNVAE